jgi:putative endonuclease
MRSCRRTLGRRAHALGVSAEAAACAALISDGWDVLGQRLRTPAGEIDLVAQKGGLCAIVE